ncbi:MAG: hypothetical protein V4479_14795 [Actinomycetota bacterium]
MRDDWRLRGQEDYLFGITMRHASWWPYRDGWDHDHCEFCWAEISEDQTGHADYNEGWVSSDDSYHWVCDPCFSDFREKFQWVVEAPSAE